MQSASIINIINMKNIDLNTVDRDELVDIRDVKVSLRRAIRSGTNSNDTQRC